MNAPNTPTHQRLLNIRRRLHNQRQHLSRQTQRIREFPKIPASLAAIREGAEIALSQSMGKKHAEIPANRESSRSDVRDLELVTQRKPLEAVEPIRLLRWLLRRYFKWRGFACRSHVCNNEDGRHGEGKTVNCPQCHTPVVILCDGKCYASIEYRGVFDDPALARWLANCPGGAVKPIPLNHALPQSTVSYKACEVPMCEESQWYRRGVAQPFIAVPRAEYESNVRLKKEYAALSQRIKELADHTEEPAPAI